MHWSELHLFHEIVLSQTCKPAWAPATGSYTTVTSASQFSLLVYLGLSTRSNATFPIKTPLHGRTDADIDVNERTDANINTNTRTDANIHTNACPDTNVNTNAMLPFLLGLISACNPTSIAHLCLCHSAPLMCQQRG